MADPEANSAKFETRSIDRSFAPPVDPIEAALADAITKAAAAGAFDALPALVAELAARRAAKG